MVNSMKGNFENQLSLSLFDDLEVTTQPLSETLAMPNGEPMLNGEVVRYCNFFNKVESDQLFQELLSGIKWRQDKMKLYGKEIDLPRLTAWYGDDQLGTCLPLAVMVLLVLLIIGVLIAMLMFVHGQ